MEKLPVQLFPLTPETLQAQLAQLNEKVRVYVGRLWQLPFAYLTVTGVFYVNASDVVVIRLQFLAALMIVLGILSYWSTTHIERRINQTVEDIAKIEAMLGLRQTVVRWTRRMMAPYYTMIVIGVVANGLLLVPVFQGGSLT
ncbi:MAG: hypothetical protein AAGF23_12555 [Acidobacteriota bacterium]